MGPYQSQLNCYPVTLDGSQNQRFCQTWFNDWIWLEYSIKEDKAYCFPCFLFDGELSHSQFIDIGFNGWKNALSKKSGIRTHIGGINSINSSSMVKWENLKNPSHHIEKVLNIMFSKEIGDNRTRLVATIEGVKLLAKQGISFRGHDESVNSLNGGNFLAVLDFSKRLNIDYRKALDNAPRNAKYTSSTTQKQILNILGNKVRAKIREEVGDSKFCILIDEALDVANKEQMAIILRFVDVKGLIKERFFKVISVSNTCSKTLNDEISRILAQYDLKVENIRGQGYDGASNMRGQFKGLQALFLKECPYAYYVHCFAHRLQLTLNAAAKGVPNVWQFFSILTTIVNFIASSGKRHSLLKKYRETEIQDLIAAGTIEIGSGKNQACTLQRAGVTRWGSHFRSISSLIKLFGATQAIIDNLCENGVEKSFQRKDIDILHAVDLLSIVKKKLQDLRQNGWNDLLTRVEAFCSAHGINVPDMFVPYKMGTRGERYFTNEHYFRVNVLYAVIDHELSKLDSRFAERSMELLVLSATFHPYNDFQAFKVDDVQLLASKFYPLDFSECDLKALGMECEFFLPSLREDHEFVNASTISDLCRLRVASRK